MKLFHRTNDRAADAIVNGGGFRLPVRLTDRPMARAGEVVLWVDVPEILVAPYEEHGTRGYRVFHVPAAIVNATRVSRIRGSESSTTTGRRRAETRRQP